ncbi:Iron-sulfur cluster carrier protein [Pontiella desulfatans]|uniref:Iron-sulfur cluster carrier protein n=1 Tax=Pontiella desulfatans TaxID=2750659 RepID=A0A6C2U1D9_PONDE|nr:P-loop NTPase [Pontiella desulfatans]VGO13762.1 Iron-sulfur cluster carrier protein [Pontiella desulfatans]
MIAEEIVLNELGKIIDPDFQRDIVSLGFVQDMVIDGGTVSFTIELTTPACPLSPVFQKQALDLVGDIPGVDQVLVNMTARKREGRQMSAEESGLKDVKYILAVSSCKGGVGKSTVAAMLAKTLGGRGAKVGLLDADIYGPSVPTLFNLHEAGVRATPDNKFIPHEVDGLKLMSFGFLMGDGPAVIRGPMVAQYMQQLLHGTVWDELDYLVIDMPPGTGDIQLTISQSVQIDASVIVTTPHQLSLTDVRKGIMMFDKVNVPVLGVVENMAYFICDGCDKRHYIFGESGGKDLEERFGLSTIAELPISGTLSGSLDHLAESGMANETTDTIIRALGKKILEKPERPKVDFDAKTITLTWPDGETSTVSNSALRRACSCALCVDEMTRAPLLDPKTIPMDIHAEKIGIIGNYAVMVDWSDGHNTGFFPYSVIRSLAAAQGQKGCGSASCGCAG